MYTVVEQELAVTLTLSPRRSVAMPARLVYRTDDPYAVHITFHNDSGSPVCWTFARELLLEGRVRACGYGDVHVWPARGGSHELIRVALDSPDGGALVDFPAAGLSAWLDGTLWAVEKGSEHESLGIEGALHRLFAGFDLDEPGLPGTRVDDGGTAGA